MGVLVLTGLFGHLIVMLWAQHDFTPVEALVALHSRMFVRGEGLYWGVTGYPFTISAYGPIFYAASGLLQSCGIPAYQSGRLLSYAALLTTLWMCWRTMGYLTLNPFVRATAVILAASSANLLFWGTTGQVDMLACCLSLAAFSAFLKFRQAGNQRALALSGVFVVLAVFTKQTSIAAGAAIGLTLLCQHRRYAFPWIAGVAVAGGGIAFVLNALTHGGYFADAIMANMNPFALFKLQQQAQYLVLTGCGVILTALAGARRLSWIDAPVYIYAAFAATIWLLTAAKIGSDLNYQIETMLVLVMCAAVSLDRLEFFPSLFAARRTWVTMLQLPLLLHLAVNLLLTARVIAERAILEPFKHRETMAMKPFVDRPGRLLSGHYDSLIHVGRPIEVEPLIYGLLVNAGLTDPAPVLRDLEARRFATLVLGHNLFAPRSPRDDPEFGRLPVVQEDAIRKHYYLVKHVDGPNDVYIYEPRSD